jgi:hypothetical protein
MQNDADEKMNKNMNYHTILLGLMFTKEPILLIHYSWKTVLGTERPLEELEKDENL